jgi:hypothetical protein
VFFAENHPSSVGYYISSGPVLASALRAAPTDIEAGSAPGPRGEHRLPLRDRDPALAFHPGLEPIVAPHFELANLDGARIRLTDLDAQATVLHFWSTSRECETDLQALARLRGRFADRGVEILTLAYSSGTPDEVRRFLQATGADVATLMCTPRDHNGKSGCDA